MHVLTVGGSTILLDCGMYHGKRDESRGRGFPPVIPLYTQEDFDTIGDPRNVILIVGYQAEKPGEGLTESGFLHVGIPAPGDEAPLV
jgi:hypothetical protein